MLITTMMAAALALQAAPEPNASHTSSAAAQAAPTTADGSAVRAALARYKSAMERLDATGTQALAWKKGR